MILIKPLTIYLFSFIFKKFGFLFKFIGVALLRTIMYVSSVQFYDT